MFTGCECKVKIQGSNEEMLASACQMFMGKSEDEVRIIATETLEGHQRAIMGNMTVEVQCSGCHGACGCHGVYCCHSYGTPAYKARGAA